MSINEIITQMTGRCAKKEFYFAQKEEKRETKKGKKRKLFTFLFLKSVNL